MFAKRIMDLSLALVGMPVLAPVFLICATWIKLEGDGSVLFTQTRVGRGGREFKLYKFRTMVPLAAGEADAGVTMRGHPRVKRASGRFLRATKLDELPQLINILRGEMSFTGPRPEIPKFVAHYPDRDKALVLSVPPGLTDWAAIRFADEEALLAGKPDPEAYYIQKILPAKLALYRTYVQTRSLWLDFYLILLTIGIVFSSSLRRRLQQGAPAVAG